MLNLFFPHILHNDPSSENNTPICLAAQSSESGIDVCDVTHDEVISPTGEARRLLKHGGDGA